MLVEKQELERFTGCLWDQTLAFVEKAMKIDRKILLFGGIAAVSLGVVAATVKLLQQEPKSELNVEEALDLQVRHTARKLNSWLSDSLNQYLTVPLFSMNRNSIHGLQSYYYSQLKNDLWLDLAANHETTINVMSPKGNRDYLILAYNPHHIDSEGNKGTVLVYSSITKEFYNLKDSDELSHLVGQESS